MKNVIIQEQECNWQDDGGMHDAYCRVISDDEFDKLVAIEQAYQGKHWSDDHEVTADEYRFINSLSNHPEFKFPAQVDGLFLFYWNEDTVGDDEEDEEDEDASPKTVVSVSQALGGHETPEDWLRSLPRVAKLPPYLQEKMDRDAEIVAKLNANRSKNFGFE